MKSRRSKLKLHVNQAPISPQVDMANSPRNVWEPKWSHPGTRLFQVVDRSGVVLVSVTVQADRYSDRVLGILRNLLEELDPPTHWADGIPRDIYLMKT